MFCWSLNRSERVPLWSSFAERVSGIIHYIEMFERKKKLVPTCPSLICKPLQKPFPLFFFCLWYMTWVPVIKGWTRRCIWFFFFSFSAQTLCWLCCEFFKILDCSFKQLLAVLTATGVQNEIQWYLIIACAAMVHFFMSKKLQVSFYLSCWNCVVVQRHLTLYQ